MLIIYYKSVVAGQVYYISLQSNGCSRSASYVGSTYLNIAGNIPTAGGVAFAGWYDNEECEGDPYTNALGQSINNWTGLEDKDLYPKWEIE